jgi:imidazolonepropionase-like amidohydrolase
MLLLKNGKIFTMADRQVIYGDILIDKGKIIDINSSIHAEDALVFDVRNHIVVPGFIDGHCHAGIIEGGVGSVGNDMEEANDTLSPELLTEDGINIRDCAFEAGVRAGITTVSVTPGESNVIGGKSCVIKTYGTTLEERMVKSSSTLNISIGEFVKRLDNVRVEMPRSRMAITYMIRSFLNRAKKYYEKTKNGNVDRNTFNEKYESVKSIFMKDTKVEICAHKVQDIQTALRLKEEFDFDLILTYCTEAYLIEDQIDKSIPLMLGPYLTDKSNFEINNRNSSSPANFSSKGFNTCLITNHPDVPLDFLPICGAIAIKDGISFEDALKSITINPAKALGIDNRVGSIEIGKDADIAVFDGDPFKARTKTCFTIVDGEIAYRR